MDVNYENFTDEERLKRCAQLLNKFYTENLTNDEVVEFTNHVLRACTVGFPASVKSLYGENFTYPKLSIDESLSYFGAFSYLKNSIFLNPEKDYAFKNKVMSNFLDTIGHEFSHYAQHKLANIEITPEMEDWVKDSSENMANFISQVPISEEEFEEMDTILRENFGDSYFGEELNSLSKEQKTEKYRTLASCSYTNIYTESQARECGYFFAKEFYEKIEPYMDFNDETSECFYVDRVYLEHVRKNEIKDEKEDSETYNLFKNKLQGSSASIWQKLEKEKINPLREEIDSSMKNSESLKTEEKEGLQAKILKLDQEKRVLIRSLEILYKDCPTNQIIDDFFVCFEKENTVCAQGIMNSVFKNGAKKMRSRIFKRNLGEFLTSYYTTQAFTKKSCELDVTDVLTSDKISEISKSLIEQGKSTLAFEFFQNQCSFDANKMKSSGQADLVISTPVRADVLREAYENKVNEVYEQYKNGQPVLLEKDFLSPISEGNLPGGTFHNRLAPVSRQKLTELCEFYDEKKNDPEFLSEQESLRRKTYEILPEESFSDFGQKKKNEMTYEEFESQFLSDQKKKDVEKSPVL